jgi:hypothetical protein
VLWTGPEARDWSSASAVDRACASGLVSSLVISLVVKLTFSLRRLRLAGAACVAGDSRVHCVHLDHGHDVVGAHMGQMAAPITELSRVALDRAMQCHSITQSLRVDAYHALLSHLFATHSNGLA